MNQARHSIFCLSSAAGLSLALAAVLLGCDGGGAPKLCESIPANSLVITEVFNDAVGVDGQSGSDSGREWIEVYNAGSTPQNLKDTDLVSSRLDGSRAKSHVITDLLIQPGEYAVLASVANDLLPAYADYGYGADLGEFGNSGGGRLVLACDRVVIDEAIYGLTASGYSQQISGDKTPVTTANDSGDSWCVATNEGSIEYIAGNYGTPGEANESCISETATTCLRGDESVAINAPQVGDLVITELLPDPKDGADDLAEWFEVLVTRDIDLNGVFIAKDTTTTTRTVLTDANCLEATAGTRLIFARSTDTDAHGLPRVDYTFDSSLVNNGNGSLVLGRGDVLLDEVTWTSSSVGKSLQVDPDFESTDGNDAAPAWCKGSDLYGATTDMGTPGQANNECPLSPGVGECVDGETIRPIVSPSAGQVIFSELMAKPNAPQGDKEWVELYATASVDLNGLVMDRGADLMTKKVFNSPECLRILGGQFAVLARSTVAVNGGLPPYLAAFGFSLPDSNGELRLRTNDDDEATTIIDMITWQTTTTGVATQLSSSALSADANDIPTNWCPATTGYGDDGMLGTPAGENLSCGD